MDRRYFILWALDKVLNLPRDVIRWEIWDYIDYHYILRKNVGDDWELRPYSTFSWICRTHLFNIGKRWASENIEQILDLDNEIGLFYEEDTDKNVINWLFDVFTPFVMKYDSTWIEQNRYYINQKILDCCRMGDIENIKKIVPKYISYCGEEINIREHDKHNCPFRIWDNINPHECPIYVSWRNNHKDLTTYLYNNLSSNGGFIYDEENDKLTMELTR